MSNEAKTLQSRLSKWLNKLDDIGKKQFKLMMRAGVVYRVIGLLAKCIAENIFFWATQKTAKP